MITIHLYITRFSHPFSKYFWERYTGLLSAELKEKNSRFVRWQDRHRHLIGKLLLIEGLKHYGYGNNELFKLKYGKYGRPYLDDIINFNISHSDEYVVCVIGERIVLGIDIEKIKEINFNDFKRVMNFKQWRNIYHSSNPTKSFFKYWTMKESVGKADSRGLSDSLLDVYVKGNSVEYNNQLWYLNDLLIDKDYCACLATNIPNVNIIWNYKDFYEK